MQDLDEDSCSAKKNIFNYLHTPKPIIHRDVASQRYLQLPPISTFLSAKVNIYAPVAFILIHMMTGP